MRSLLLALLLSSFGAFAAQDTTVIRGPYLQLGTDNSMVIRWRSTDTSVGIIKYGTTLNQQNFTFSDSTPTAEHEIKVSGLLPFTQYYYSIYKGNQLLTGQDASYTFTTNPIPGTVQPLHFWITGDMGKGSQQQYDVRDTYWNNVRNGRHTDSWLWLGDNVYSSGTDSEYQYKMFAIYPEIMRSVVSRPAPGNHDYQSVNGFTNDGPYYQNFTMPRNGEAGGKPSGQEGYYSYDYGNVHFISLNSEVLLWYLLPTSDMCKWLKDDLAQTTQPWKIAYWHQPPYTKGSHDSDDAFSNMGFMRQNIAPILEQYGVDIVLTGHSHNYERSYPIHGHYGTSGDFNFTMQVSNKSGKPSLNEGYIKYTTGPNANKGTMYIVCGNGGATTSGEPLNHPIMYFNHQDSAGFMTIDVNGMELTGTYYDHRGNVRDDFTITKSAQNPNGVRSLEDEIIELNIAPNPFSNWLRFNINLQSAQQLQISLYDITGKLVRESSRRFSSGNNNFSFNTMQLPKGTYILNIKSAELGEVSRTLSLQR